MKTHEIDLCERYRTRTHLIEPQSPCMWSFHPISCEVYIIYHPDWYIKTNSDLEDIIHEGKTSKAIVDLEGSGQLKWQQLPFQLI